MAVEKFFNRHFVFYSPSIQKFLSPTHFGIFVKTSFGITPYYALYGGNIMCV